MESTQAGNWEGIRETKRGRGERKSKGRRVAKERSKDRGKN